MLLEIEVAPSASVVPSVSRCERGADFVNRTAIDRQDMCPTPRMNTLRVQVRVHDPSVPLRDDDLIEVRPNCDHARPATRCWLVQFLHEVGVGSKLARKGMRQDSRIRRTGVGRSERDQRVYAGVATEALHVVASDDPAHRVAHDVHPLVAGFATHRLHEHRQSA